MIATNEILQKYEALAEQRKAEIRNAPDATCIKGATYYVSNVGDDANDGRTPATAWATLGRISEAELAPGDGVLLCRGDLFRGMIKTKPGVTYGAYGKGEKPRLYGWDFDLADPKLWEETDAAHHIWKMKKKILDPGTLVFNGGEAHSYKLIPSYIRGKFVCRDDESKEFVMAAEMQRDLDIFWYFTELMTDKPSKGEDFPVPDMCSASLGDLYLRCDKGNPGEVFASIEAVTRRVGFAVGSNANVHIDNICMMYIGHHGVAAGGPCVEGLRVTNCEIGWVGGTIQHYLGTDPNYPQGGRGTVTRFGNGIEIYGGCKNYEVSNCYIYQSYDAGITHQVTTHGKQRVMENVLYKDNVIEDCVYSIEYFLDMTNGDTESYMKNIEMCGNILRRSGYGWGQQRHNYHTPAHIKGWSFTNKASEYRVHHNVFDRAAYRMLHLVAKEQESCPEMWGNTYIQHADKTLGQYGGNAEAEPPVLSFENAEEKIATVFGDKDAKVYTIQ